MFMAILRINIRAIKLDDITVTFQPNNPNNPVIITTEVAQPRSGITTHLILLNISQRVAIMNKKTPIPNTIMSFLMYDIMSSAIMGIPPKCIFAFSEYLLMTSLISFMF